MRLLALITMPLSNSLHDHHQQLEHLQLCGQAWIEHPDALAVLMVYLEQPLAYHERYVTGRVDGLFRTTIGLS